MITKIEKITVYVNSQEEAKKFWTEKIGFSLIFERPIGPGSFWIEVGPENAATTLILYSKELMQKQNAAMVAHPSIMFYADNIETLHSEFSQKGVSVDKVQNNPWGKMFSFKDPDGNTYMVRG